MQLKKINKRQLTNYYLSEKKILEKISQKKVRYCYKKNEYLNIWLKQKNFERLYYFIAYPNSYDINTEEELCVCDVICRESDKEAICQILHTAGMRKYSEYMKWICSTPIVSNVGKPKQLYVIDNDDGIIFINDLYIYFDELSDLLPEENDLDDFIENKYFIGVHDIRNDTLAGGLVYTKQKYTVTEEYLYVTPAYRGQGISKLLHKVLYQKYYNSELKYIAWIRNNNLISINLHSYYNYQKQNQLKITFLKGQKRRVNIWEFK